MSTKRVLASGVFDVIHPGHVYYLEQAKQRGDYLIVVVTSDGHAKKTKRRPKHNEGERTQRVAKLPMVDEAFIGAHPFDLIGTVTRARPDVIALGFDQTFDEPALSRKLAGAGINVKLVRLPKSPDWRGSPTDLLRE